MTTTNTTRQKVRIRPDIAAMDAYTPTASLEVFAQQLGRPVESLIKLDANENPYGPGPQARAALAQLDYAHIYPDPQARTLRAGLAEYAGVPAQNILAGAGADELIELILQLFISPGDAIVTCPPTFSMYAFDAPLAHARVIQVSRTWDFALDMRETERAVWDNDAKLLFLCSPNNPDGGLITSEQLETLLALPVTVVLDEAYVEFAGEASRAARVLDAPNLIVLRTFSKWAGLAGLRVGYGVFPSDLMPHLWKIKPPYNLNVAADAAARASLQELDDRRATVNALIAERERLQRALAAFDFLAPYPSRANFVLCRVTGDRITAAELRRRLAEDYGILIRYYNKPGMSDHVRISAGKPEHTDALLSALNEIWEAIS